MKKFFFTVIFGSLLSYTSIGYSASIDEINARGALRVCSFSDRLPFSSRSGENKGLQIELAEEIAKELNVDLEITWVRYRFHARKAGCDMMMEAVSRERMMLLIKRDIEGAKPLTRASDSKKQKFPPTVSIPIVKMETYLVGLKELVLGKTNIKSIKNLNIGVMRGTWSHMLNAKIKN